MPVFLARVPLQLPLDAPLPRQCAIAIPLQEAIEHRATAFGDPRRRPDRARTHIPSHAQADDRQRTLRPDRDRRRRPRQPRLRPRRRRLAARQRPRRNRRPATLHRRANPPTIPTTTPTHTHNPHPHTTATDTHRRLTSDPRAAPTPIHPFGYSSRRGGHNGRNRLLLTLTSPDAERATPVRPARSLPRHPSRAAP